MIPGEALLFHFTPELPKECFRHFFSPHRILRTVSLLNTLIQEKFSLSDEDSVSY